MKSMLPIFKTVFGVNKARDWPVYSAKAIQWQIRKWRGDVFNIKLGNGAIVKVYPSTAYSGIFYARNPEGSDMLFLRKHAHLAEVFVDVGANVGLFSASLFDKFKKIICFEPAPSSFRALSETCALNPSIECALHNIGLGETQGELFFENEFDFSTTSRIVTEENEKTMKIPVDTLDHVVDTNSAPMIMKIDVEGYEEKVFLGADNLFRQQQVKLLMFERLGRTNLSNVRQFLEYRDYIIFRVNDDLSVTTEEQAITEPCINLFACPEIIFPQLRD